MTVLNCSGANVRRGAEAPDATGHEFGDAEVGYKRLDLRARFRIEKHVVRFQVAVHHWTALVKVVNRARDLAE